MARSLSLAVVLLAAASVASEAQSALRVPQVPVSGTALADFFAAYGENIDVHQQQLDVQTFSGQSTSTFSVTGYASDAGDTLGVYNNHVLPAIPVLYAVLPGDVIPLGLYAQVAFRTFPTRLVVRLVDASGFPETTRMYLAGPPDGNHFGPPDASNFSFYVQRSTGATFYMQDARNPGGAARILAYVGSGPYAGYMWLACETGSGPGGDFADFIALVPLLSGAVPVSRTSWGMLKQRFR